MSSLPFFCVGCAELETVEDPAPVQTSSPQAKKIYPAQFQSHETLHFILKGQNISRLTEIGDLCEEIYRKIMFDTNLLFFKPKQNYLLVIHRNRTEYHRYTGYPLWSGGGTVTRLYGQLLPTEKSDEIARTSIFTSEESVSHPLLAHEISHLIFNEFMEFKTEEEAGSARWLNEGLATYEELEGYDQTERAELLALTEPFVKRFALPIKLLVNFKPIRSEVKVLGSYIHNGNRIKYTNIDLWYWQVRSLTKFLIERDGPYRFYLLLNTLKQKKDFVPALTEAYPNRWRNLEDLETEWKQSL